MKKYFLFLIIFWSCWINAAERVVLLENPELNRHDMTSIKRGAQFFATNCMSCHTLIYLRYDKFAQQQGITYDKMPTTVKKWPFDIKPPDLSLTANIRGSAWLYTFLHSFYQDPKRPTGSNNLLFPNTVMPNMLAAYQGLQVLAADIQATEITYSDIYAEKTTWYDLLTLVKQGSMTPAQFDQSMTDLVNFLNYAAEPYYIQQHMIGWWVLLFLILFFILAFMLKQEYWKDIHS